MKIAEVEVSNLEKTIFPKKEITKREILIYYEKVADKMLPFLKDRPLTIQRFPDGIDSEGFYQKNAAEYFPDYIERVSIETDEGMNTQVICNNKKSLIYLVNQGTITFHIWLAKKEALEKPDKVVFDLDPPKDSFKKVKTAAKKIGDFLRKEGKDPKLLTTGIRGFHLYYKVRRDKNFDDRRKEIRELAEKVKEKYPDLLTTEIRKEKRDNKVFIDYLRNAYGQTTVCPYSLRPNEACGVVTPIKLKELTNISSADQYTINNIFRRLGQLKK